MDANVEYVRKECGCSENRAKKLLSLGGNDPKKAVKHHLMLQAMLGGKGHSAAKGNMSASSTPSASSLPATPPSDYDESPGDNKSSVSLHYPSKKLGGNGNLAAWDFVLPRLPKEKAAGILDDAVKYDSDGIYQDPTRATAYTLNFGELCAAVQHGAGYTRVQSHLRDFDNKDVKYLINDTVEGIPSIFFAAESNDPSLLRLWITYGANPSAIHPASGTPLLAYVIALSEQLDGRDTSDLVTTLLSLGASPKSIPDAFYKPFNRDLSVDDIPQHIDGVDIGEDQAKSGPIIPEWNWCQSLFTRNLMARTTHLTNRYYLDRATRLRRPGVRHRQVLTMRNAEGVLGIPHYLIGQTVAANQLLRKLLTYLTVHRDRPLVLVFAGPSGHGKTELARKLGYLLGLALEVVDCTIVNDERELFGPRPPYHGCERGSPLNNFLAHHNAQRSIVFLDEFEKTSHHIHQSLLVPFDNGEYQDRRTLKTIDCKRTIWILATNALDYKILTFCDANPEILLQDAASGSQSELSRKLAGDLRASFLGRFGAPVTGRVSDFIPFLPFSKGEQAVVTHKFLLNMAKRVAAPVVLAASPGHNIGGAPGASSSEQRQQLLGDVRLRISRDASVCSQIAEAEYSKDLGARSLHKAVDDVEDKLVETYLEDDTEIKENASQGKTDYVVDIRGGEIVVRKGTGVEAVV